MDAGSGLVQLLVCELADSDARSLLLSPRRRNTLFSNLHTIRAFGHWIKTLNYES